MFWYSELLHKIPDKQAYFTEYRKSKGDQPSNIGKQ